MSEDDRAAKAARAKAMLKKRQLKKAEAVSTTPPAGAVSPSINSPPSRTFSVSPPQTVESEKRDLGAVLKKDDSETSWLSSLPRVGSPPRPSPLSSASVSIKTARPSVAVEAHPVVTSPSTREEDSPPEPSVAHLTAEPERLQGLESKAQHTVASLDVATRRSKELDDQAKQLQASQQQTISLLVSEKASLTSELEQLKHVDSKAHEMDILIEQERNRSRDLRENVLRLESDAEEAIRLMQQSKSVEKELTEKCREKDRELQLTNATISDLRKDVALHQAELRELREQIQRDDRVERLENSLKNTQDRADELEFQLSKLKQAHVTLKSERDEIDTQLHVYRKSVDEWSSKHSNLHQQHLAARDELSSAVTEKHTLLQDNVTLQSKVDASQQALTELREKQAQATSELTTSTRQLQIAQSELRNANRRADDAERMQQNLQAEGTNLMRSLDEMRPKIVELTAAKLDLGETIDSLEHALRTRDATIVRLESVIDELQAEQDDADRKQQDDLGLREKEISSARDSSAELQKAYTELQAELETALASIRTFEAERSSHRQDAVYRLEEIDRLTVKSRAQAEELLTVRRELEERTYDQEEEQDFLERAQNEIESLRSEISSKDEEIERLREAVSSPTNDAPHSLDAEMLGSLRQQHALDLSAAQSQIRALETSVFEEQAKSHVLQKQLNVLEDELRSGSRTIHGPFSPGIPSKSSSRAQDHADLPRAAFTSLKPSSLAPPLSRTFFEQNLNPQTRHKRKVSLSMLKARIDSELAVTPHLPSRSLSPAPSLPTVREPASQPASLAFNHSFHRPQFLDESHVFWCHSCRGDLVIL